MILASVVPCRSHRHNVSIRMRLTLQALRHVDRPANVRIGTFRSEQVPLKERYAVPIFAPEQPGWQPQSRRDLSPRTRPTPLDCDEAAGAMG